MDLKSFLVKYSAQAMELEVEVQQKETMSEEFRDTVKGVGISLKSLLVKYSTQAMELKVKAQQNGTTPEEFRDTAEEVQIQQNYIIEKTVELHRHTVDLNLDIARIIDLQDIVGTWQEYRYSRTI